MPTFEELAGLSPNMRKVLLSNADGVEPKETYWITLQGMIARGLILAPKNRSAKHYFSEKGLTYKTALEAQTNDQ